MQLTEQQIKDLIRRQKAFEAAKIAHEAIETAFEQLSTVTYEAHQGSVAYKVADGLVDKMSAAMDEAFKLLCDIQGKPNCINS